MVNDRRDEASKLVEAFFKKEFGPYSSEGIWTMKRGQAPWDSLKHIELINAFEVRFSIQLNFEQASCLSTASDFVNILADHPKAIC